jgi:hypothetical protein
LGVLDHPDDVRERRVFPDGGGLEDEVPIAVDRGAEDLVAPGAEHGQALAGDHRLVHGRAALDHVAVHRNPLARPHHDPIPHAHLLGRHLDLPAVADHARGLRPQAGQLADRVVRLGLGAVLQVLPEQDQRHDDRGHLEVQVHAAGRELVDAVRVRGAGADGDERVHVRRAPAGELPRDAEELAPRPEHDRGGERELN